MALSNNANCTVKQLIKGTNIILKKLMFYVVTSSLFLITGIQVVNAETCAPDVAYLKALLKADSFGTDNGFKPISEELESESIDHVINKLSELEEKSKNDLAKMHGPDYDNNPNWQKFIHLAENSALRSSETIKQLNCIKNGGKFATSSANFDVNGNYTGSGSRDTKKNDKSGTPDIEVFFRGNTYFARVRPNTSYPADCTVEFTVTGQTYSAPNNVYLNDIAGNIFSEALGGNPQSEVDVSARAVCKMSSAEKDRRETKQNQAELKRQFEKKKK